MSTATDTDGAGVAKNNGADKIIHTWPNAAKIAYFVSASLYVHLMLNGTIRVYRFDDVVNSVLSLGTIVRLHLMARLCLVDDVSYVLRICGISHIVCDFVVNGLIAGMPDAFVNANGPLVSLLLILWYMPIGVGIVYLSARRVTQWSIIDTLSNTTSVTNSVRGWVIGVAYATELCLRWTCNVVCLIALSSAIDAAFKYNSNIIHRTIARMCLAGILVFISRITCRYVCHAATAVAMVYYGKNEYTGFATWFFDDIHTWLLPLTTSLLVASGRAIASSAYGGVFVWLGFACYIFMLARTNVILRDNMGNHKTMDAEAAQIASGRYWAPVVVSILVELVLTAVHYNGDNQTGVRPNSTFTVLVFVLFTVDAIRRKVIAVRNLKRGSSAVTACAQ